MLNNNILFIIDKNGIKLKIIQKRISKLLFYLTIKKFKMINYIIIINLVFSMKSFKIEQRKIYSNNSFIRLKVNRTGNINLFYPGTDCSYKPLPDEVNINGVDETHESSEYYINSLDDDIRLIFENPPNSVQCLFQNCYDIIEIDFSNFDSSNVEGMVSTFYSCSSLKSINFNNFNTSKVKSMNYMFYYCSSLTTLNLSNFDTSNIESMYEMFSFCSSLTFLNLSNFDTSKVEKMEKMFNECSKLIVLDLSSFNVENIKTMSSMFYKCSSLVYLDLSNFNAPKVSKIDQIFSGMFKITSIKFIKF